MNDNRVARSSTLSVTVERGVATVTMNRPEKLNSFTFDMLGEWAEEFRALYDREDVRVVVLTGAGRAFSAGGDVGGFDDVATRTPYEIRREVANMQGMTRAIYECPKPTIAAINGIATGGGLDLALACDIRFVAEGARMAETYVAMGLVPGGGGAFMLPRIVGSSHALEMLLAGDFIDAGQARDMGLVSRVVSGESLLGEAFELAVRIAGRPPISVQALKKMVRLGEGKDLTLGLELAAATLAMVRKTEDHLTAVRSFRDKTTPVFDGR